MCHSWHHSFPMLALYWDWGQPTGVVDILNFSQCLLVHMVQLCCERDAYEQRSTEVWHWSFPFCLWRIAKATNVVCYWFPSFKPGWIWLQCCIVFRKLAVPNGLLLLPVCPVCKKVGRVSNETTSPTSLRGKGFCLSYLSRAVTHWVCVSTAPIWTIDSCYKQSCRVWLCCA